MNPSATGWISMFFSLYNKEVLFDLYVEEKDFYTQLRNTGFLYGMCTESLLELPKSNLILNENEFKKINLLHAMSFVYFKQNPDKNTDELVDSLLEFYKEIEEERNSFLQFLKLPKKNIEKLEDAIHERTHSSILSNSITSLLTDIQIFLDVVAYEQFLKDKVQFKAYLKNLKQLFFQICFTALNIKKDKDKYDHRFLELLENSSTYLIEDISLNKSVWDQQLCHRTLLEKLYLIDLSLVSVWSDFTLEKEEEDFIYLLADELELDRFIVKEALDAIKGFAIAHETDVKLFEYAHPIKRIYGQSSSTVKTLIVRNKDRLLIELNESGELLNLLGNATYRELSSEEKTKVRNQLLDICKTIPSLTIFLLPGGSLLLPLLIKFIPQLLPSAFTDNQIDIKSEEKL
ncbi:MAG TPA: LETM1-related biofilm-associated protein [Flavobacteriaceae bacterium]|nr:LETM1-related biofilm-associated protein [Flavobacteriaceae bacterium]